MGFNLSCLGDLGTCTGEWEIRSVSGRVCIDGYTTVPCYGQLFMAWQASSSVGHNREKMFRSDKQMICECRTLPLNSKLQISPFLLVLILRYIFMGGV